MAYAFNEDKSKVEVLSADQTYPKSSLYTKSETDSKLSLLLPKLEAQATYVSLTSNKLVPPGVIVPYAGAEEPSGWLFCDGRSIAVSDFPALFAAIQFRYGGQVNYFNLPDLRQKFPLGLQSPRDTPGTGGSNTKTLAIENLPAHTHGSNTTTGSFGRVMMRTDASGAQSGPFSNQGHDDVGYGIEAEGELGIYRYRIGFNMTHEHNSVGEGQAFDSMPPYITLNYIIKY